MRTCDKLSTELMAFFQKTPEGLFHIEIYTYVLYFNKAVTCEVNGFNGFPFFFLRGCKAHFYV